MEGIENITEKIAQDAQSEIDALHAQTDEKVRAIAAEYQAQADKEREEILARGRRAAQERLERLSSAAQMETRKLELGAKQEMLSESFELALEKLCALPEQKYIDLLATLLAKASLTKKEQVIFSAADRKRVGAQAVEAANRSIQGGLTLSDQTRPIRGGFILADGKIELNCAFETLVRLQRETLEKDVIRCLFEET